MLDHIPVFFRDELNARSRFFAPGTFKPAACVDDWIAHGLPIKLHDFKPASRDDLCLAHDAEYVDGVLACEIPNGFHGTEPDVAETLPYTSGAMLAAGREALRNGFVACAPVSGFHHAQWDSAAGYCTFNGLIVTARRMQADRLVRRVGILDLDQHYGDGTDGIIAELELTSIRHETPGKRHQRRADAEPFLAKLPSLVRSFGDCDLLLYQAGADPHVDDPLGGWMTTEQLARRDRIVFATAKALGLPVAWNLAGGYQRDAAGCIGPVLEIHANTMRACCTNYGLQPKPPATTKDG